MTDLCFQLYAEARDVDTLLDMIRATSLTDYIRYDLNGDGDTSDIVDGQPETQPLHLINPAGFYKSYLLPSALPVSVAAGEIVPLDKGYYKGVVFDLPCVEVKIDGQWIAFDARSKDLILAQNPMALEWRLNGTLFRKYGFSSGDVIQGRILTVDDQWNGLNLEKEISVPVR